jgi:hypothetical protein
MASAAIISGSPSSCTAESISVRSSDTSPGTANHRRNVANSSAVTSCKASRASGLGIVVIGSSSTRPA